MYLTYDDEIFEQKQKEVLDECLKYQMLNVKLLIYERIESVMEVIGWFPYDNGNCANEVRDLVRIGRCEYTANSYEYTEHAVAEKPTIPLHLHGCPLNISISIQEPYVIRDDPKNYSFSGIEIDLVRNIAKFMGMMPRYILIKEVRSNRVVNEISGIYSTLMQG